MGVKFYNGIPNKIRELGTFKSFKRGLKIFYSIINFIPFENFLIMYKKNRFIKYKSKENRVTHFIKLCCLNFLVCMYIIM
jgi:hypothetical protein